MIYSTEITIPVLCPINFSENVETYYYPHQDKFTPVMLENTRVMAIISAGVYSGGNVYLNMVDAETDILISETVMTKAALGSTYKYVSADTNFNTAHRYVYFTIGQSTILAKSSVYELNPKDTNLFKTLHYNNAKNDWNQVFTATDLKMYIPCGFNPTNYTSKRRVENYQDQDIQNINIYAQPYETEMLTIGTPTGLPNWMYRKLNAVFACDTIKINGAQYRVAEGAELEKKMQTYDGLNILEIELQPINNYAQ